jgi:hypothetical protein
MPEKLTFIKRSRFPKADDELEKMKSVFCKLKATRFMRTNLPEILRKETEPIF